MSRWFRWYEGTTEDGKFRLVARKSRVTVRDAIAVWAVMLEDAADPTHPGVCTMGFDLIESVLDLAEGQGKAIALPMSDAGMIEIDGEQVRILNWSKRQFRSDADVTAAERQRRKRERDKEADNEPVTRDARNGHAALDTDSETDTEEPDASASARARGTRNERSKPKRRLPEDWEPGQNHHELAGELGIDVAAAATEFKDYWIGEGGVKADWDRTFSRRLRAIAERPPSGPRGPGGGGQRPGGLLAAAHAVLAATKPQ